MFFPLLILAGKILLGAAVGAGAAAVVFIIGFSDVLSKLRQHKLHHKDIGVLVKEHLANGNVRVVGSVFSKKTLGIFPRKLQHQEIFEGKLDSEMQNLFSRQDRIKVRI